MHNTYYTLVLIPTLTSTWVQPLTMADAPAESPHPRGKNHSSGSSLVPSLSTTMQHRCKVPLLLIEMMETSSRSPSNTTWASAAVISNSHEEIAIPKEVSPPSGPRKFKHTNSPLIKCIPLAATQFVGPHTLAVTPTSNSSILASDAPSQISHEQWNGLYNAVGPS